MMGGKEVYKYSELKLAINIEKEKSACVYLVVEALMEVQLVGQPRVL